MKKFIYTVTLIVLTSSFVNAQQSPAPFVTEVYDDIYQVMHTRQSPEKPNLVLSDNTREIALFSPSMNQIAIGQDFIELARSFGKDSMNVIAQIMSHELAHVLLEQSTIIKNIGSGYASKEFNKRLKKTHSSLRDSLYERHADEYSFFYGAFIKLLSKSYSIRNKRQRKGSKFIKMILRELISKNKILSDHLVNLDHEILNQKVKGISSNSKDIKPGYIFVAIKGKNFDGESQAQGGSPRASSG